jgi:uncharacterized RDD family membrane protein YckC
MKPVDRYVHEVLRCVFASAEDRERLESDLRAHFAAAKARGESASQIIAEMGTPSDIAAAFNAEREIRYAGFWQRLFAFAADFGALLGLMLPPLSLVALIGTRLFPEKEPTLEGLLFMGLAALAVMGILVFYFPILEARFGKTLGKHLMRIRVVRESGAPIGLGQAFVRRLSLYFEMLVVDALFIPFTDKRQRALDIVAKTIVAREPGESASTWRYLACVSIPVVTLALGLALLALTAQV